MRENAVYKRNNKKGLPSLDQKHAIGREPISRGGELFCKKCTEECHKKFPQKNLHRIYGEMQCCDCSEPLVVGGKKKKNILSSELLYVSMQEMLHAGLPPKREIALAAPLNFSTQRLLTDDGTSE